VCKYKIQNIKDQCQCSCGEIRDTSEPPSSNSLKFALFFGTFCSAYMFAKTWPNLQVFTLRVRMFVKKISFACCKFLLGNGACLQWIGRGEECLSVMAPCP
jgi:hypothetical protein